MQDYATLRVSLAQSIIILWIDVKKKKKTYQFERSVEDDQIIC
jgi:hypothetical protein